MFTVNADVWLSVDLFEVVLMGTNIAFTSEGATELVRRT